MTYRGVLQLYAIWPHLFMQQTFLHIADQCTSGTVHDAFWHAGCPARIHDHERVAKRHPLKRQLLAPIRSFQKCSQFYSLLNLTDIAYLFRQSPLHNQSLELSNTTHPLNYLFHFRSQIDGLSVIHSPVVKEDKLGSNLPQALQYTFTSHIG
jgi:hypothetical protein